jgi:hypothetical protein
VEQCVKQKTKHGELGFGCPLGDRVEPEEPGEARSIGTPETMAVGSVELLGKVLSVDNIFDACGRVVKNLPRELCRSTEGGWYKPAPVRRLEIPKVDGGTRQLGIPTVIDRMVQ